MMFTCRTPRAKEFSFCRSVENSSGDGWWMRRAVHFLCGLSGSGWYFGFIKHDKEETMITQIEDQPTKEN